MVKKDKYRQNHGEENWEEEAFLEGMAVADSGELEEPEDELPTFQRDMGPIEDELDEIIGKKKPR